MCQTSDEGLNTSQQLLLFTIHQLRVMEISQFQTLTSFVPSMKFMSSFRGSKKMLWNGMFLCPNSQRNTSLLFTSVDMFKGVSKLKEYISTLNEFSNIIVRKWHIYLKAHVKTLGRHLGYSL